MKNVLIFVSAVLKIKKWRSLYVGRTFSYSVRPIAEWLMSIRYLVKLFVYL